MKITGTLISRTKKVLKPRYVIIGFEKASKFSEAEGKIEEFTTSRNILYVPNIQGKNHVYALPEDIKSTFEHRIGLNEDEILLIHPNYIMAVVGDNLRRYRVESSSLVFSPLLGLVFPNDINIHGIK